MKKPISKNEQKLLAILKYAPVGLVEINQHTGVVASYNLKGEELLAPIFAATKTSPDNLFPALEYVKPGLTEQIKCFDAPGGIIFQDIYTFIVEVDGLQAERHYHMMANKQQIDGSLMVSFDDFTERHQREAAIRIAQTERAVEQGKFEIASGVLHDIGNAIVGFGSYLTRMKRSIEGTNIESLQKLSTFFSDQRDALASAIGEAKAKAVIDMLNGIINKQQADITDTRNSIAEQLNIISHIQEILNIQRQYVIGENRERKLVNLRSVVNDCMAMLFASFDKRGINFALNIPTELPLIKGDRTKLMQVILNVLKNSLESMEVTAKNKKIDFRIFSESEQLIVQIQDNGIGFDADTAGKLFERGFTTKSSGTGIGLYNCKTIIESHSGTIQMLSDGLGSGSKTIITFPLN